MGKHSDTAAKSSERLSLPAEQRYVTVAGALQMLGCSRTELYRRFAKNELQAFKSGTKTMVSIESIRAYEASYQPATFRAPKVAA